MYQTEIEQKRMNSQITEVRVAMNVSAREFSLFRGAFVLFQYNLKVAH